MIKTKIIKFEDEREEIEDVICNMCGQSCATWRREEDNSMIGFDGLRGYVEGGFGSKIIGDTVSYTFDLCEKCTMELIEKFKIPAKKNEESIGYKDGLIDDGHGPDDENPPKEKDESLIPFGPYCHGDLTVTKEFKVSGRVCPYWDIDDSDEKQLQENGYCHFLEMGDWNIGHGLIWDKCKECGINMSEISNSEIVETANKYFPLSFSTKELREKLIEVFDVCESEDKLRERLNYLSKSPAIIACEDDIFAITGRDIYGNDLNRKDKK